MKLYICQTYYHTLIALIKAMIENERFDLLIADNIPDCVDLESRLKNTNCFGNIYIYKESEILKNTVYKNTFIRLIQGKKILKKAVESALPIKIHNYKDIYLFHDYSKIGVYIIQENIKYHLLEDALDYYKYFDQYYRLSSDSYTADSLKGRIKRLTGIGNSLFGTSENCIDIEVNDINGIKISLEKVIESPRKELFDQLSAEQRKYVFNVYAKGKTIEKVNGKTAILFTQPLFTAKQVGSIEEQIIVFDRVINKYYTEGYQFVIKPHPRDSADYSSLIEKYKCGYIDKNLPSEILNYDPESKYDIAISITSTAINFLEHADRKIFMGMDFVNEALKNAKDQKESKE